MLSFTELCSQSINQKIYWEFKMSNVGQVRNICILSRKIGSNVIAYFELIRKHNLATLSSSFFLVMTQTLKVQDYILLQDTHFRKTIASSEMYLCDAFYSIMYILDTT